MINKIAIIFLIVLLVGCVSTSNKNPSVYIGQSAFHNGDYELAYSNLYPHAESGNAQAQFYLGLMYLEGKGVKQNNGEALKWFQNAAIKGYVYAQNNLGTMYYYGLGVEVDYVTSVNWHIKAAQQGHASSQFNLGLAYFKGLGIEKDPNQALKWVMSAAKQGNPIAQSFLGHMYAKGEVVEQNDVSAYIWFSVSKSIKTNKMALDGLKMVSTKLSEVEVHKANTMVQKCIDSSYQHCTGEL